MPDAKWEDKYKNDNLGENSEHGAEKVPCVDCKFRKIFTWPNGKVIDTGRGATCKAYPVLKPMDVMSKGAPCPKYQKDNKEKE